MAKRQSAADKRTAMALLGMDATTCSLHHAPPPMDTQENARSNIRQLQSKEPDWDTWLCMATVQVWQGVALSINVGPDCDSLASIRMLGMAQIDVPDEFNKRYRIAKNHYPLTSQGVAIPLADWVEFTRRMRWTIPPQLAGLEVQSTPAPADTETPLGTRERNSLYTIIAALCKDAKLNISTSAKTAGLIQSTALGMGLSIGESTIEKHLKQIKASVSTAK